MSIPERAFPERSRERERPPWVIGRRWRRARWRVPRLGRTGHFILGGLVALVVIASFFVDEPMRRYVEGKMNQPTTS